METSTHAYDDGIKLGCDALKDGVWTESIPFQPQSLHYFSNRAPSMIIPVRLQDRRAGVALIIFLLAARASTGLIPPAGSSRSWAAKRRTSTTVHSSLSTEADFKFSYRKSTTRLPVIIVASGVTQQTAASSTQKAVSQKIKQISPSQRQDMDEFQWLNWVYKQWRPAKAGELSDEVLKQMVPAISRWGRRKSLLSAERAEELLERLIEENLVGNPCAELTVAMFNAAMNGFAKIGHPGGVQRILRRMDRLRSGHKRLAHLKPDVFSMSTLATAWAKSRSPEAASKALGILNYMDVQKLIPNTITYNAVLRALAMGNQIDKAIHAEDIVKRMERSHADGEDCRPDVYSYQSLIQAWAQTSLQGSPQKAEQILRSMDRMSEDGNKGLSPNVYCFTTTIHAWAKSSEKKRARNAYEILQHMRRRYTEDYSQRVKPNVVAFTAVLNACSWPADDSEREEAFRIAQLTMAELSLGTYDKPNFLSYAAFLSVCASTLDDGDFRDDVVRKTFLDCAKAGHVAQIVMEKLKVAASYELYDDLIGGFIKDNGTCVIPRSWTSCIKGERSSETQEYQNHVWNMDPISESSKLRLKAVRKFGGKSGIYSSGKAPKRLASEGISWIKRPMGAS